MSYVNTTTAEVVSLATIRAAHPNVSIPEGADVSALGYAKLVETPRPSALGKKITAGPAAQVNGTWQTTWTVADYTTPELDAIKKEAGDLIEAESERRKKLGTVTVATNRYKVDADSRSQLNLLSQKGNGVPGQKKIRALNASGQPVLVSVNQALVKDITDAIVARDFAIEQVAETHLTAMSAALDPMQYDFSTGWPT